jgi:hypothetical protein
MDIKAFDLVRQLAASQYLVRALHVAAELNVADAVGEAGTPIATVAQSVGADADALGRVLRLLASRGIFRLESGLVHHSPASLLLCRDHPASLHSFVRMFAQPIQWQSAGELLHAVTTGEAVASRVYPAGGLWGYYATHPSDEAVFGEAMAAKSSAQIADLLAHHDFSQYRRIVDVGGSRGHLLRAILAAHPQVHGVLFDLPPVIETARHAGSDERLDFVPGDFFTTPLPGGDAIVLMEILHDWDDAACGRILQAVRRAATPLTRLLVIEIDMTPGPGPDWPKLLDIVMLAVFGARQRTNAEYEALLAANGFRLERQTGTPAGMVILEAVAAEA